MLQAQLEGGEWVDLLGPGHPGIAEVKWCANRFTPFLCIAPTAATEAGKQDAEEFIEVSLPPSCVAQHGCLSGNNGFCICFASTTLSMFRGSRCDIYGWIVLCMLSVSSALVVQPRCTNHKSPL